MHTHTESIYTLMITNHEHPGLLAAFRGSQKAASFSVHEAQGSGSRRQASLSMGEENPNPCT